MVRGIECAIKVCSEVTAQIFSLTQDTVSLGSCTVGVTIHKVVRIQHFGQNSFTLLSVLFLRIPCILTSGIKGRDAEYVPP